ncbi:MAG: SGNH/GDSL hydrolase family protein [Chthoniobacterales bacterium]
MKTKSIFTILAVAFLGAMRPASAAPFSDMISFGDSLTDVGNVAGVTTPGYAPVIDGYYQETHFSDGVLWNETLASYWGLPARTPGRVALPPLSAATTGNTWAWGGSEAGSGTVQPTGVTVAIPNLLTETADYLSVNTPDSSALFTIWSGADNLLVGGAVSPSAAAAAADAVKTAMQQLDGAGARNILVFNMPKLGDTPYAIAGGPIVIAAVNVYALSYNAALDTAIAELRADPLFHSQIYFADAYTLLKDIADTVNADGTYTPDFFVPGAPVTINNVTSMGLDYFDTNGTYPANYLFWDDVHPTTQGHQVIAGMALKAVTPVPEAAVPAWLLAGGATLLILRRRKIFARR